MNNIINIFDDVWIEANTGVNTEANIEIIKKPIRYHSKKLSDIEIPFIYSFPDSFCEHDIELIKECIICKKKLNKPISDSNIVFVMIGKDNYLSKDYIFPLYTDKNEFTIYEFLIQLKKRWERIYEEEGFEKPLYNFANRIPTSNKYGIGCHNLNDLSVYDIQIFAYTEDNIPLIYFLSDS